MLTPTQKTEIKELILSISRRISELPEASVFSNSDYLTIVQEETAPGPEGSSVSYLVNKKVTLSALVEYIKDHMSFDGALFFGVAKPSDSYVPKPVNSDAFWIATTPGTYTKYGNIVVGDIPKIIYYDHNTQQFTGEELWKGGPDVVDNLNSDSPTDALSARQGKVIKDLIDSGYMFKGVATTSTDPGTVTQKQFYLAGSGTYPNFGSITVESGYFGVLMWDDGWTVNAVPFNAVTSVGMTVPTGLSVSGSPITSFGTLALSFTQGYSIPTTAQQTTWDNKQDTLVSGTNIKTINGNSLLGGGDIEITSGGAGTLNTTNTTAQSTNASESLGGNVNLHKVAKTGNFNDLLNKPATITEATISGWGFTKNAGTVTSISVNGSNYTPTNGLVDLGNIGGGSSMNYQKVTSAEYEAMQQAGTLQSNILYIIVDPNA